MVRPITKYDREIYLAMTQEFYSGNATLAPLPPENGEKTFCHLMEGSPYAFAYILEKDGIPQGYALLAKTWSQEAGGVVIWIEELYIRSNARSQGLGKEFFSYLETKFSDAVRFRLEVEEENDGAVRLYKRMGFEFFPYSQMKKGS
jgi:GNAT superfamily N-acetyltransferase